MTAAGTLTSFDAAGTPPAPQFVSSLPQFPADIPPELARRFRESFGGSYQDWLTNPPYASFDGAPNMPAGLWRGASGTVGDRRGGKDLPQFWSEQDLRGYRVMSRWLRQTNPFMVGFGDRLIDYVIADGFQWQACRRGQKKQAYATGAAGSDPVTTKGQNVFDEFRDRVGWVLRSREGFDRYCRDGEVGQRFFRGARGCGPEVRWVNAEQIGSPTGDTTDESSYGVRVKVVDGKSDAEHVVAVYVRDHDGNGSEGEWLNADKDDPAARVLFHKKNTDSDVKRGLPDSFSVHEPLDEARKLVRNMVVVACAQSAIAWLEKFPTATMQQVRDMVPTGAPLINPPAWANGTGQTVYSEKVAAGTILRTEGSREFAPGPASASVTNYVEAEQAALRMVCVRYGMPPYMTAKADDVNFASSISAGSPFAVAIKGTQTKWAAVERAVALKVLDLAVESGVLTWEERQQLDVEVIAPSITSPDKKADTDRLTVLVDKKLIDPYTAQQELGYDPSHIEANWKAWNERNPQPAAAPAPQQQPAPPADDPFGGPSLESVVAAAVARLLEDRGSLVKRQITNKAGNKQTVWVNPNDRDGDGVSDPAPADSADGPPREHVLAGLADVIGAADPEARKNPALMQRIGDAALTAAAKAYGALVRLTPHLVTARKVLEGVFDTPEDMGKFGYNPGMSSQVSRHAGQPADAVADTLGISSHLAAQIASHVLGRAWVYAVGKMGGGKAAESDGIDAIAAALREAVAHVAAGLGLPEPPDVAAIAAKLRERAGAAAESVGEDTFAALVEAGVWLAPECDEFGVVAEDTSGAGLVATKVTVHGPKGDYQRTVMKRPTQPAKAGNAGKGAAPQANNKGGGGVDPKEHAATKKQAAAKVKAVPVPPPEKVAKNRATLEGIRADAAERKKMAAAGKTPEQIEAKLGPTPRPGGDARGSSYARRARAEKLFEEFGGKERGYVVCHGTGIRMHYTDDPAANPNGYPKFEQGKIFTFAQGGGYTHENLLPESFAYNRSRNDAVLRPENAT